MQEGSVDLVKPGSRLAKMQHDKYKPAGQVLAKNIQSQDHNNYYQTNKKSLTKKR